MTRCDQELSFDQLTNHYRVYLMGVLDENEMPSRGAAVTLTEGRYC